MHASPDLPPHGLDASDRFAVTAVSHLRLAATRYPYNHQLKNLVADLLAGSETEGHRHPAHDRRELTARRVPDQRVRPLTFVLVRTSGSDGLSRTAARDLPDRRRAGPPCACWWPGPAPR
ncbi:hypothetical protein ACIBO5_45090 [Nonomuraea angiospora]|uniref:hypothetical protein n=1 Tax=Nonomuraea angiospora TaxID=46172 RepID=UPI00378BF67A